MNKPHPKTELLAHLAADRLVKIECHSEDARAWFLQSAQSFGSLALFSNTVEYLLHVYEGYDVQEVIAYLNSYNQDGTS